jgi:hypothetical protein
MRNFESILQRTGRWDFRRVRKIAKSTNGFIMSVRPHGTTPKGGILMEVDILVSFEKSVEEIQVPLKSEKN